MTQRRLIEKQEQKLQQGFRIIRNPLPTLRKTQTILQLVPTNTPLRNLTKPKESRRYLMSLLLPFSTSCCEAPSRRTLGSSLQIPLSGYTLESNNPAPFSTHRFFMGLGFQQLGSSK